MVNHIYLLGRRLFISKSRGVVRGSVIFLLTHLLLIIGIIFTAEVILLLLGVYDIHVPLTGKIIGLIPKFPWF